MDVCPGSTALSRRAEHPGFSASCHRRGCLRLSSGRTDSSRLRSLIRSSRSHATSPLFYRRGEQPPPGSAALSAAAGRTQLLRFPRRRRTAPSRLRSLIRRQQVARNFSAFPAEEDSPLPAPQPYPQTAGRTQLLRFPRRGEQPPPGSAALSAATGRTQLLRFPAEENSPLPAPQPYPRQQVARNFSAFPAEGGQPLPAPQPYPQQQVARNFTAFPAEGGICSATFPTGAVTAIRLVPVPA